MNHCLLLQEGKLVKKSHDKKGKEDRNDKLHLDTELVEEKKQLQKRASHETPPPLPLGETTHLPKCTEFRTARGALQHTHIYKQTWLPSVNMQDIQQSTNIRTYVHFLTITTHTHYTQHTHDTAPPSGQTFVVPEVPSLSAPSQPVPRSPHRGTRQRFIFYFRSRRRQIHRHVITIITNQPAHQKNPSNRSSTQTGKKKTSTSHVSDGRRGTKEHYH